VRTLKCMSIWVGKHRVVIGRITQLTFPGR
jgi:hypothetical protein